VAGALFAAFLLHNGEEALTYARVRPATEALTGFDLPAPSPFWAALVIVTIVGGAVLLWAGTGPDTAARRRALRLGAAILLLNVLVPHLPAAVLLGGYAPGVVTAVLVNLPLSLWVLRRV